MTDKTHDSELIAITQRKMLNQTGGYKQVESEQSETSKAEASDEKKIDEKQTHKSLEFKVREKVVKNEIPVPDEFSKSENDEQFDITKDSGEKDKSILEAEIEMEAKDLEEP